MKAGSHLKVCSGWGLQIYSTDDGTERCHIILCIYMYSGARSTRMTAGRWTLILITLTPQI